MVHERRWTELGFYYCRDKLRKNTRKIGGTKIVRQLIQADDTDFPHMPPSARGWTLDKIHNWITGNDKKEGEPTLGGAVNISKVKLLLALKICNKYSKSYTIKNKSKKRVKTRKRQKKLNSKKWFSSLFL